MSSKQSSRAAAVAQYKPNPLRSQARGARCHKYLASLSDEWRLATVRLTSGLDDDREVLRHRYPVLEQDYALKALESDQLVATVDLIEALGGGYHNPDVQHRPTQKAG